MEHFRSRQQQQQGDERKKDRLLALRCLRVYIDRRHERKKVQETKLKKKKGKKKNHDVGTATIDLRFDAADNDPDFDTGARGDGRIVFSFSSDTEADDELGCDVDRSTSDATAAVVAVASFA